VKVDNAPKYLLRQANFQVTPELDALQSLPKTSVEQDLDYRFP